VHIGPSDYVPWLHDRKWAYIRLEGRSFGDVPLNVELKLEVHDSPNSAGIVIDAVRCTKLALDRGIGGALEGPSSYFMKSPPVQYSDNEAKRLVEDFIDGDKAGANGGAPRRAARTKTAAASARR
jgi:myo-inositol-1-phosphate synthase